MHEEDIYREENPLIDSLSAVVQLRGGEAADHPRMPERSGVVEPRRRRRLSDSYFKLQGDEWLPQIVDDPTLPARILAGGEARRWQLRETCVTRLLFETGGRISEVVGLSLGDWWIRGLGQEVSAFSKGSHLRRIKYLRFSANTAKLLRRYTDGERRQRDPQHRTLGEYRRLAESGELDLFTIPLFLSRRGTALSAGHFRDHYWAPACQAAGLDADIHQARHWYVTMAVRQIYEAAQTDAEIRRRLRELIEYIKWRRGWETIQAYDHYFDAERHAEIQDALHRRLDASLKAGLAGQTRRRARTYSSSSRMGPVVPKMPSMDPELRFLEELLG
jgi:integrase